MQMSRTSPGSQGSREDGFTLIEVLSAIVLMSILLTISASSLRRYWLVQSVDQVQGEQKAQMRELQQRAVSESNPLVFGVRYRLGTTEWSAMRYDPQTSGTTDDDLCTQEPSAGSTFPNGVQVTSASFAAASGLLLSKCPQNTASDRFVWFFAKGSATGGPDAANPIGRVEFTQPNTNSTKALCVVGLTGRVYERGASDPC